MPSIEELQEHPSSELSVADALSVAVQLHRRGDLDTAEVLYRRILELDPQQPDALNFLGIVSMHRGRIDTAIELIEKAISIEPERAERYNNLGNVLLVAERVDDAAKAYRKAIELAPMHAADAYNNLGIIFRAQQRYEESARAYKRAIEIAPGHAEAYNNYGNLLAGQGRVHDAIRAYSKAISLRPYDDNTKKFIALAHAMLGEYQKAAEIYRKWLQEEPDHPGVKHLLAACSGEDVPDRATDAYIEQTFDGYSKSFDSALAKLDYRAPELVAQALRETGADPSKNRVALDAGCGTGLCGPLLAPYVAKLVGVDLSAGMLERSRARNVYDELVKVELTQYLQGQHDVFDLIVSADTLVYFGVLDHVVQAAYQALRPGGLFIFTVEKADEADTPEGHRLNFHGRYAHTRTYVECTLQGAGFAEMNIGEDVLRQERAEPVEGLVVVAIKVPEQNKGPLYGVYKQAR